MDCTIEIPTARNMNADSLLQVVVTLSTYTVYLTAESLCRRIPCLKKFDKYFTPGSRHLQRLSFPLMCVDTMVVLVLLGGTVYAAFATDITLYPLVYPGTTSPPMVVCILLSANLGRHVAKMQLAIHNKPAEKTTYPIIVCLLVCGFIITSLASNLYMGLCLVGILSETGSLLKWLHYLPSDVTRTRGWFSALVIMRFLVTFVFKGVFAIALSCLAFVVQFHVVLESLPYIQVFPLSLLALSLMILNFAHMVTLTMFVMDHFKSKPRKFASDRWNTIPRSALNTEIKCTMKQPISYDFNNVIRGNFAENADVVKKDAHITNKNLKEKNCNVEQGLQQCTAGSGTVSGSDQRTIAKKSVPSKARKCVPATCMLTIPEETASQISVPAGESS